MKIVVNGVEFYECGFCEKLHSEIICPCFNERISKELREVIGTMRKRNKTFFCIIDGKQRLGMSDMAYKMSDKFFDVRNTKKRSKGE